IKVHFARRDAIPAIQLSVVFDAGNAADPKDKLGTQSLMLAMLDEGTTSRNSIQIAEEQERLGASISASASMDGTTVSMYALMPNLAPSLDLMADIVKNPAFDPGELERIKATQLARIAAENTQPKSIALRTLPPLLFGKDHPYGVAFTGTGDPEVVAKLTRNDLASFHHRWIRADNAEIFAVGNTTLAELKPLLEKRFGHWRMTRDVKGVKNFDVATPAAQERIILVNRPQSPQSVILAGQVLNVKGTDDLLKLIAANDVMGGSFLSRMNMDLRETKGWSYGVRGSVNRVQHDVPYILSAPVQADKTGPAIAALKNQMKDFLGTKGVTPAELERTVNGDIRELPGSFETSSDVLGEMQRDVLYDRPFDYVETLANKYRTLTAVDLDAAARAAIDPDAFTWVVVGDKDKIMGQLEALGMPITVVENPSGAAANGKE
ncbi:MAG: insulinase family protein, partial [Alphaproteobacteria bacterium]|nr:insulinase family protein [Alphaproteobacteria bacterium]